MRKTTSGRTANSLVSILMAEAVARFERLIVPSLVPIYASQEVRTELPVQVGTGFLVAHGSRPALVTAKHTLRGRTFQENPGDKAVHVDGAWVYIGDGQRVIAEPKDRDLAIMYMDEFPLSRCLLASQLAPVARIPKVISMGGFLARDFKRRGATLSPALRIYSNVGEAAGDGLIGLRYPKRRNIDTKSGTPVVSSIPVGLSGCPMVDTIELIKGSVSVVGVFIEQDSGQARGEDADHMQAAILSL